MLATKLARLSATSASLSSMLLLPSSSLVVSMRHSHAKSTRKRGLRMPHMWPTEFATPLDSQRDLVEVKKSEEYEKLKLFSFKAAVNQANCSLFRDPLVDKLTNMIMKESQREVADRVIGDCFKRIKALQLAKVHKALEAGKQVRTSEKTENEATEMGWEEMEMEREREEGGNDVFVDVSPVSIIHRAVANARPFLRLREVQVGSVMYSVPIAISLERSEFEGMRWLITSSRERTEREVSFADHFAELLIDTAYKIGPVVAKRKEHHEKCEQNRAYINLLKTRAKAIVRKSDKKGGRKR